MSNDAITVLLIQRLYNIVDDKFVSERVRVTGVYNTYNVNNFDVLITDNVQ